MSTVLVINAGSSSLKFALLDATLNEQARGEVERIGGAPQLCTAIGAHREKHPLPQGAGQEQALAAALEWLRNKVDLTTLAATAHRIVHGGEHYCEAVRISERTLTELEALAPLAPLHQPYNLAAARTLTRQFPHLIHSASFDTAFHAGWPDCASRFALPRDLHEAGIRRYGFHGLSYAYLVERANDIVPKASKLVLAHLGGGASVCAVRDRQSVDCSLGFSALDGLPMATRCGALDPGVIFHLMRAHHWELDALETMLYTNSGLQGVSGLSGDVRDLLASSLSSAQEAVELFVYQCKKQIAAMSAALNGADALVFSGGIGAHAAEIRARIVEGLSFLGFSIDTVNNTSHAERIEAVHSKPILVIPANEEKIIAAECVKVVGKSAQCSH